MIEMTDKQMEEKKKEFFEKFVFDHKDGEASYWDWKRAGASCVEVWQWIEKLVEEVEDRDRKLLEEVANSDYELGKMQGIIEAKEHEQHRKKIRKELLRRYN